MAEIARQVTATVHRDSHSTIYEWLNVASGDTCTAVITGHAKEVSVNAQEGTAGSLVVAIHGTNDPDYTSPNGFAALSDLAGSTISMAPDSAPLNIRDNCYQMKPVISGAGGSGVNIYMMVRHS